MSRPDEIPIQMRLVYLQIGQTPRDIRKEMRENLTPRPITSSNPVARDTPPLR
jgi:hypothetical protein